MKEDYIYSSTYVRMAEKHLLDQTDIDRMIGASDAKEALKVLENTNYAQEFKESISKTSANEYNRILKADLQEGKKMLYFLTDDEFLIKFVLSCFDVHNIKLFFKEKILNIDMGEFVSHHGTQDIEKIKKEVNGENTEIDEIFKSIIDDAKKECKKNKNANYIDLFLDKKDLELSLKLAKKIPGKGVTKLVKKKIDILNFKISVRSFLLEKVDDMGKWLISGGNINYNEFLDRTRKAKSLEELLGLFRCLISKEAEEAIDYFLEDEVIEKREKISRFFKRLDDASIKDLRKTKFIFIDPEVIVSYFWARFNANRNVRIIIECKLAGIGNKEIAERVRLPF